MSEQTACRNCGSMSRDPEWCDTCGADLSAQANTTPWLDSGAALEFVVAPKPGAPAPTLPTIGDDTLPPPSFRTGATDSLTAAPSETGERDAPDLVPASEETLLTGPAIAGSVTAPFPTSPDEAPPTEDTSPALTGASAAVDPAPTLRVTLTTMLTQLEHKRAWLAEGDDGRTYRVEERVGGADEPVPEGARPLDWLLDLPLAATPRGTRTVRLFRHVPGELLHERLAAHDSPLTPADIVDWIRPVVQALKAIHDAGYLCLRLCPYTIKYTHDDGVFLEGVEVLYAQDTAYDKLPAIAGYTAPEIYTASVGEPPTPAADVYMVAMVVYYLIAHTDPPASLYTEHTPVILARDVAPEFPLGFAPVLGAIGALDPADRSRNAEELLDALEHARDRSVRLVGGIDTVRVAVAADTHIGIIKRLHTPENQDAVFSAVDEHSETALMLVADGVSTATYGSGDLASAAARRRAEAAWRTYLERPDIVRERGVERWLGDIIQRANCDIVEAVNADHAPFTGEPAEVMGSTCVIAFIHNGICHLASLGDSRAYLVRDGFMEQITRDHNLLTLGIAQGLDADLAVTLPQGDALAKCLGAFDVADGRLIPAPVEPDTYVFPLLDGDRLLLCSDGVTDYAGDAPDEAEANIYDIVMASELPELICLDLIRLANSGGGGDNIGAALAIAGPTYRNAMEWFVATRSEPDEFDLDLDEMAEELAGDGLDDD